MKLYVVKGGIFTSTDWDKVVEGTEEVYGPFYSYEEALAKWRGATGWMVDTCTHRLFVEEHNDANLSR